jgi:hypothetical protein
VIRPDTTSRRHDSQSCIEVTRIVFPLARSRRVPRVGTILVVAVPEHTTHTGTGGGEKCAALPTRIVAPEVVGREGDREYRAVGEPPQRVSTRGQARDLEAAAPRPLEAVANLDL